MKNLSNFLVSKCILFRNLRPENIDALLRFLDHKIVSYEKNSLIAQEGDFCDSIGIVLNGKLELQTIYPSGKVSTLTQLTEGNTFGEAILFASYTEYPQSITSVSKSDILFIKRNEVVHMLTHHPIVLENFLTLMSNKLIMLNRKVKILSLDTIRQKICNFLIKEYKLQNNLRIQVKLSRKHMAEHMAVQRPSLSRELIKMEQEGLIKYDKDTITILDLDLLEMELLN